MADVVVFFGKMFNPNLMIKKMFFWNKVIFWKNAIFGKSEKIHNDSPEYYVNFRYLIEVRIRKLREIWIFFMKWCAWNHDLWSMASSATSTNTVLLSTFSRTLLSKSDGKWLFIAYIMYMLILIYYIHMNLHLTASFT